MSDVIVEGTVLGWVDDGSFPVSVRVQLTDVDGKVHQIIEKEPVLFSIPIPLDADFPFRIGVRGTCLRANERAVDVEMDHDIVTTEGASTLTFGVDDVLWV